MPANTKPTSFAVKVSRRAFPLAMLFIAACGAPSEHDQQIAASVPLSGAGKTVMAITDTIFVSSFNAAGIAAPFEEATLSTTLMGTITDVRVREGDLVSAGQVLLQIDAGELAARAQRMTASVADAEAMHREAVIQERRFASLYADSAATRAQYEAAQTGLARAEAGLRAAKAASAELESVSRYATLRAPFSGTVTRRMIDRGGMAAPGVPLLVVQNSATLRIKATAPIEATRTLRKGQSVDVTMDEQKVHATIEGIVPSGSSNLFLINALIPNTQGRYAAGSSATINLPVDTVRGILIPSIALVTEGDMIGVITERGGIRERRWVRIGDRRGELVEVTSGLARGDSIVVPVESKAVAQSKD